MKRLLASALSIITIFTLCPTDSARAEELITEWHSAPAPDMPDNDELFAAYAERQFYPQYAVSLWGTSGREQLSDAGKQLYDYLRTKITAIANGTLSETTVTVPGEMMGSWGVDCIYTDSELGGSDVNAKVASLLEAELVVGALLADLPYEMYWFQKGANWGYCASYYKHPAYYEVAEFMMLFPVVETYRSSSYDSDSPTTNTAVTGATSSAVANAKSIVDSYSGLSDYEKIIAYRDKIMELVSYNTEAAQNMTYGDPWQLIYVFDNDPSTNVVCEGYCKAFQYLCDLSTFTDPEIICYSVTGTITYNGSAGGHMWNILTMDDGKNYLADLTNSDSGTAGSRGGLFLNGVSGSVDQGYEGVGIKFAYYDDTKALWGTDSASVLNVSSTDYEVPEVHTCAPDGNGWYYDSANHWQKCDCGAELNKSTHSGEWETIKEAEIGIGGLKELRCSVCGYLMDEETIAALEETPADPPADGGTEDETPIDPPAEPEIIGLRGDVTKNGELDSRDYVFLKRAYFGTYKLDETATLLADVNNSGGIDSRDYVFLKRAYFGTYKIADSIKYIYSE